MGTATDRMCGWTDTKLPRVTKSVLLSGMLTSRTPNPSQPKTINADFLHRQTISGEHGLDSNGVYVTVADSDRLFARSPLR
jgi:hypothetical protein